MYILLFTCIITASTSLLILTLTPLNTGIIILCIALTLALLYASIISSWIAFLIFLIYVSGILVIFAYFVALSPNQKTHSSFIIPFTLVIISLLILINIKSIKFPQTMMLSINTFYVRLNIPILILIALILLFAIIVVVKLVTNNKGPLRPFKLYV